MIYTYIYIFLSDFSMRRNFWKFNRFQFFFLIKSFEIYIELFEPKTKFTLHYILIPIVCPPSYILFP